MAEAELEPLMKVNWIFSSTDESISSEVNVTQSVMQPMEFQ